MSSSALTVAIIDDNSDNLEFLRRLLPQQYQTQGYNSADAGLNGLKQQQVDMIIVTLPLKDTNNHVICQQLQEANDRAHTPIIVICANDNHQLRLRCLQQGASDYLLKPVDIKALNQALERHGYSINKIKQLQQNAQQYEAKLSSSQQENQLLTHFIGQVEDCDNSNDLAALALHCLEGFGFGAAIGLSEETQLQFYETLQADLISTLEQAEQTGLDKDSFYYVTPKLRFVIANPSIELNDDGNNAALVMLAKLIENHNHCLQQRQSQQLDSSIYEQLEKTCQAQVKTIHQQAEQAQNNWLTQNQQLMAEFEVQLSRLGLEEDQEEELLNLVNTNSEQLLNLPSLSQQLMPSLKNLLKQVQAFKSD